MIKWCAYCQHFITEFEPFDDYRMSHSICAECLPKLSEFHGADADGLADIIDFYRRLDGIAQAGDSADVEEILRESRELGIRPIDLMIGMLQPLLAKIGDRWAANLLTAHTEHRFSALVGNLLASLRRDSIDGGTTPEEPDLLLVNAEGNYHTLGLQMAEVYLAISGIPAMTILPGLPTEEVLALVQTHRPKALGFSVALPTQMKQVREVKERLESLPYRPQRILVGGPALRLGLNPDPSFRFDICRNLSDMARLLA